MIDAFVPGSAAYAAAAAWAERGFAELVDAESQSPNDPEEFPKIASCLSGIDEI